MAAGPKVRSVLFVCTGNTCRSPMAEAICRSELARQLNCPAGELADRGFVIRSAGVLAAPGMEASPEAVAIAREFGADLAGHRSRMIDPDLLNEATDVIAMTAAHAMLLGLRFPGTGPEPELLCGDDDLPDPIGGSDEVYRACAAAIQTHVKRRIAEWL